MWYVSPQRVYQNMNCNKCGMFHHNVYTVYQNMNCNKLCGRYVSSFINMRLLRFLFIIILFPVENLAHFPQKQKCHVSISIFADYEFKVIYLCRYITLPIWKRINKIVVYLLQVTALLISIFSFLIHTHEILILIHKIHLHSFIHS
uniref:Uncharacterized protein n=2 Tax=Cacopsylla melanoneura TaxID=428564 RepID=A0A8D9BGI5_9HEMI